ncbi:sensor histidine kinase [Paenibacillus montanisoli]|uniref:Two-component sensor histidine kinase n=1 Tax=Paenibacillus montanisoli TaxID=2081970 RepID=A0A328U5A6_9BACL|nr:histidine kinase [Paenibacillus montanisoli]RAP76993.1 two-component sensor histidine kinase [Paenibacillus montanisoli]
MNLSKIGRTKWFVYQKIVTVFIILFVPLIVMNMWINYKGLFFIKHEIADSAVAGASFYSKQLDDQLYFIRSQQLQFLNDQDLQKLSFQGAAMDKFELVQLINQVKDRLMSLINSSEYVVNAGVYVKEIEKTVSIKDDVLNTPNEDYTLISTLIKETPKPSFYMYDDRIYFIESANNSGVWSYIEISRDKLLEALKQIASLYQNSEVLLGGQNNGVVLSTLSNRPVLAEVLSIAEERSGPEPEKSIVRKVNDTNYFITRSDVSSLHLSLVMFVNQNELIRPLSQFNTWFFALLIIAIVVLLLYSFSIHFMIHRPLTRLTRAFQLIETDNLNLVIESKRKDEFHYLFNSFNRMAQRLKRSIQENYEQKIALQHSELKQLQSQINPHFLYNSFFNIYMMCKTGDSDGAGELSQKLGSYYQYITRSGSDEVPLYKEFRHALDYCEIQCIRFSNRIQFEYEELPEPAAALYVPRLIIQPVVENVFEHAFEDGMMEGVLYMRSGFEDGVVSITVEDNGNLLTDERLDQLRTKLGNQYVERMEQTGIINVGNRLQLKYGPSSGLFVSRSKYGGLKVDIKIDYKQKGA